MCSSCCGGRYIVVVCEIKALHGWSPPRHLCCNLIHKLLTSTPALDSIYLCSRSCFIPDSLVVEVDARNTGEWSSCVDIPNLKELPKGWTKKAYVGLTATTGALADNHDRKLFLCLLYTLVTVCICLVSPLTGIMAFHQSLRYVILHLIRLIYTCSLLMMYTFL